MLGARGRIGRRVVARLEVDGHDVVAVPRDAAAADTVGEGDLVVNLATSAGDVVAPWATAASRAGGYLDVAATGAAHQVVAELDLGPAPVLPGAGFASILGDALAVVASRELVGPSRVDVTAYVPSRRSLLAGATPRERTELLEALVAPMAVLVDGRVVTERVAEARRLAWFPRPVGPHHAAATPGTHWRTLPRVLPTLRTVRSATALRSSTAELVQALGTLGRWPTGERLVRGRAARPGPDRGTVDERWALVVEVTTAGGGLVRGWAYGHDRHGTTAQGAALLAGRLRTADASASGLAVGATEVMDPEELLDTLAARTDLRWSVTEAVEVG